MVFFIPQFNKAENLEIHWASNVFHRFPNPYRLRFFFFFLILLNP